MVYPILLIEAQAAGLPAEVCERFRCTRLALMEPASAGDARAAVLDMAAGPLDLSICQQVLGWRSLAGMPLVAVAQGFTLHDKLRAFELGLDDVIDGSAATSEIEARIVKSLFNHIASAQLNQRLELAAGQRALGDPARLHEFWLAAVAASGPDELGQLLFRELADSKLVCSLQLRVGADSKNMEAHGMAKDLESQLLTQLAGAGPELEFGRRAVINRGRASALIKNLPPEPPAAEAAKTRLGCLLEVLDRCLGIAAEAAQLRERLAEQGRQLEALAARASNAPGANVIPFKDNR